MRFCLIATALFAWVSACDSPGGTSSLLPDIDATVLDGGSDVGDRDGDFPLRDGVGVPDAAPDAEPDSAVDVKPDAVPDAVADVHKDAPVTPDADATPDAKTDVPPNPTGAIAGGVVLSEVDSPFVNVGAAAARFIEKDPAPPAGTTFGPCVVAQSGPSSTPPKAYGLDAGVIQVSGTSPVAVLTPVDEAALGTGYTSNIPESHEDLLPPGGGLITVKGAGGAEIPAFSAVIQAPEEVALKSPAITFNLAASASQDFTFTWNAGLGDSIVVNITPVGSDYQAVDGLEILCTASATATSLTVPKAALAAMLGGSSSRTAIFGVTRSKLTTAAAGSSTVSVGATRSTGGPLRIDK
ncbi:MAG: hypothetical protein R3F39_05975 [Myxococcota bacterium]